MLLDWLINIQTRGVLTMLGLRKTPGSMDVIWPGIDELLEGFN